MSRIPSTGWRAMFWGKGTGAKPDRRPSTSLGTAFVTRCSPLLPRKFTLLGNSLSPNRGLSWLYNQMAPKGGHPSRLGTSDGATPDAHRGYPWGAEQVIGLYCRGRSFGLVGADPMWSR